MREISATENTAVTQCTCVDRVTLGQMNFRSAVVLFTHLFYAFGTEQREETACGAKKYVCKCSLRNVYVPITFIIA